MRSRNLQVTFDDCFTEQQWLDMIGGPGDPIIQKTLKSAYTLAMLTEYFLQKKSQSFEKALKSALKFTKIEPENLENVVETLIDSSWVYASDFEDWYENHSYEMDD